MSLLRIIRTFLQLDVADKPGTGGTIKQRARAGQILISWDNDTAELSVVLTTKVDAFAAENGGYGVQLAGAGIDTWPVELHGDNDSAVDPKTGVVLLNRDLVAGEPLAAWLARVDLDPRPMMLQGDWLAGLLKNPGVSIAQLALGQMAAADAPPYHKYAR